MRKLTFTIIFERMLPLNISIAALLPIKTIFMVLFICTSLEVLRKCEWTGLCMGTSEKIRAQKHRFRWFGYMTRQGDEKPSKAIMELHVGQRRSRGGHNWLESRLWGDIWPCEGGGVNRTFVEHGRGGSSRAKRRPEPVIFRTRVSSAVDLQ